MAAKHNNPAEQSDAERELTNGRKDTAAEDLENAEDHCYGGGRLDDMQGVTKIYLLMANFIYFLIISHYLTTG